MLELKELKKYYGYNGYSYFSDSQRKDKPALDEISLSFAPGEVVGLFGENGAGKTTLFKCILYYTPRKGEIILNGEKITHRNISEIAYGISNNTFFAHLDILEHKDFYTMNFPLFNESRFGLLVDFFQLPTKKQIKDLSQGQKNQVETILALSQGATYILLDEPFANNDIFNREDFYKVLLALLQPEECLILASHLIDEIKNFVSRVVLLRDGKLLADKTTEQDLDQEGLDLVPWMKRLYGYENRVAQFVEKAERELK